MEAIRYVSPAGAGLLEEDPQLALESFVADAPGSAQVALLPRREKLNLLGTDVDVLTGRDVLSILRAGARHRRRPRHLCYVNAHSLNLAYRDGSYGAVLARADFVLNDGIGLELAAKMRGTSFPENLNGSDFTLRLLELAAREHWRVFFYGGQPGVAEGARQRLSESIAGLEVVGVLDGFRPETADEVAAQIRATGADLLIVALGQPAQELWLDRHLVDTGCHLGLGVGAFLDFASGRIARAPQWMNKLGVEWVYRLVKEPGRLWRRYVVGNPLFLWRAWRLRSTEIG